MNKWQPISTAPKDGTSILVCGTHDYEVDQVSWDMREGYEFWEAIGGKAKVGNYLDYEPLYWQHMPKVYKENSIAEFVFFKDEVLEDLKDNDYAQDWVTTAIDEWHSQDDIVAFYLAIYAVIEAGSLRS